jgi:hypothetical protein
MRNLFYALSFFGILSLCLFTSCTKFDKPIACIDAGDTAYYYPASGFNLYLRSSCSKGAFIAEWKLPNDLIIKSDKIEVSSYFNKNSKSKFILKVTAKDGKEFDTTSFTLNPKLKLPSIFDNQTYKDYYYGSTCALSQYIRVNSSAALGSEYDFYLKSNISNNKIGAKLTNVSNQSPYYSVQFTIPSQNLGGNNVSGTGSLSYSSQNYPIYYNLTLNLNGLNSSCTNYNGQYPY